MTRRAYLSGGVAVFAAIATLAIYGAIAADDYPNRPIRMIVGFAPGGGTDLTARPVAQKLSELLGQQVIVENRPGAAGNIATEQVARAAPDGYTILMGTIAALAINPSLYGNLKYDPEADFAPVIQVVDATNVLVLHPSVQANSVQELIALAKQKSLSAGSSGIGATGHLSIELFNLMAGVKLVHVPYKGGGPAMTDLVGGQVQLIFATAASAIPQIKAGRIKGIAVTTIKRSALMPDLPTLSEAGLTGFDANNWYGTRGAGEDAARDHRAPQRRSDKDPPHARREGDAVHPGARPRAGHARAVRRLHQERAHQMGPGDPGIGGEAGVNASGRRGPA